MTQNQDIHSKNKKSKVSPLLRLEPLFHIPGK